MKFFVFSPEALVPFQSLESFSALSRTMELRPRRGGCTDTVAYERLHMALGGMRGGNMADERSEACWPLRSRSLYPIIHAHLVPLSMQQSNYYQTISALLQQFQHPQNPPILAPVNPLQQQLLNAVQAVDQNTLRQGGFNALQSLQQQTPQPSNIASNPTQLLSDALKLIAPVGQSPNDEQLLVMALHSGLSQGFDHKKAIETLHGVCPHPHIYNLLSD